MIDTYGLAALGGAAAIIVAVSVGLAIALMAASRGGRRDHAAEDVMVTTGQARLPGHGQLSHSRLPRATPRRRDARNAAGYRVYRYNGVLGADPDSTWVAKQLRACRAPVSSLNHWNTTNANDERFALP